MADEKEVTEAIKTDNKSFNYSPIYFGPGSHGHCILMRKFFDTKKYSDWNINYLPALYGFNPNGNDNNKKTIITRSEPIYATFETDRVSGDATEEFELGTFTLPEPMCIGELVIYGHDPTFDSNEAAWATYQYDTEFYDPSATAWASAPKYRAILTFNDTFNDNTTSEYNTSKNLGSGASEIIKIKDSDKSKKVKSIRFLAYGAAASVSRAFKMDMAITEYEVRAKEATFTFELPICKQTYSSGAQVENRYTNTIYLTFWPQYGNKIMKIESVKFLAEKVDGSNTIPSLEVDQSKYKNFFKEYTLEINKFNYFTFGYNKISKNDILCDSLDNIKLKSTSPDSTAVPFTGVPSDYKTVEIKVLYSVNSSESIIPVGDTISANVTFLESTINYSEPEDKYYLMKDTEIAGLNSSYGNSKLHINLGYCFKDGTSYTRMLYNTVNLSITNGSSDYKIRGWIYKYDLKGKEILVKDISNDLKEFDSSGNLNQPFQLSSWVQIDNDIEYSDELFLIIEIYDVNGNEPHYTISELVFTNDKVINSDQEGGTAA